MKSVNFVKKLDNIIKKGEKLTYDNIWSKRPGTGIPSYKMKSVIGKTARRSIKKDNLINKRDFF